MYSDISNIFLFYSLVDYINCPAWSGNGGMANVWYGRGAQDKISI